MSSADEEELDRMEEAILTAMSDPEINARVPTWEKPEDLTRMCIESLEAQLDDIAEGGVEDDSV